MNMEDTIIQRVVKFYKSKNYTVNSFSKAIKMPQVTVNNQILGKRGISFELISNILLNFPELSSEWLIRGNGFMFNEQIELRQTKSTEKLSQRTFPLLSSLAAANLNTILSDDNKNILGMITIPNIPDCDGALYVRGDSMYPLLKSGDIVAFKNVEPKDENIIYGEMYIVDMVLDDDDYLAVKYIKHSERGKEWIKLVSQNDFYQSKDVLISSLRAMALVKLTIRMNTMK